jgi:hypothetical protein
LRRPYEYGAVHRQWWHAEQTAGLTNSTPPTHHRSADPHPRFAYREAPLSPGGAFLFSGLREAPGSPPADFAFTVFLTTITQADSLAGVSGIKTVIGFDNRRRFSFFALSFI